jgi:hypothetical protein
MQYIPESTEKAGADRFAKWALNRRNGFDRCALLEHGGHHDKASHAIFNDRFC